MTQQTAPVAAAAAAPASETPFYKKMFGGVADLFSPSASQPAAETAQNTPVVAPAVTPNAKVPAKPQKKAEATAQGVKVAQVRN